MSVSTEMPRYKCHKEVWALKIKNILPILRDEKKDFEGGAMIVPEEEDYGLIKASREYMEKHDPQVGGYYVVYKGGYKSYSPAHAFEDGYTLIG